VWDFPRPPRVEPVASRIRVELAGVELAATERALRVLETAGPPVYYFPLDDVRTDLLEPSLSRSFCEWKGVAHYVSARVGARFIADIGWGYADPDEGFEALRDHLAFFAGRADACYVGDERIKPQPGEFYGGWITHNVVGPFKGEPGSESW
jgi:uncharacterized protein (DUF427 family)